MTSLPVAPYKASKKTRPGTVFTIGIAMVAKADNGKQTLTMRDLPVSYTHLDVYKRQTMGTPG